MLKLPKDKVAVTPIFDPDMSPTGLLHIPDMAKERCDQGIIKYIGPDCKWCKQGMYVIFSGYTGTLISVQGEGKLIVMPEDFVVAELGDVDNINVPGLYYRTKLFRETQELELYNHIRTFFSREEGIPADIDDLCKVLAADLSNNAIVGPIASPYYQADYENIFNYMALAFQESDWYRNIKVNVEKPKPTDYDRMGEKNASS